MFKHHQITCNMICEGSQASSGYIKCVCNDQFWRWQQVLLHISCFVVSSVDVDYIHLSFHQYRCPAWSEVSNYASWWWNNPPFYATNLSHQHINYCSFPRIRHRAGSIWRSNPRTDLPNLPIFKKLFTQIQMQNSAISSGRSGFLLSVHVSGPLKLKLLRALCPFSFGRQTPWGSIWAWSDDADSAEPSDSSLESESDVVSANLIFMTVSISRKDS